MKIPSYYCPHCPRFRKWHQVTNVDALEYANCKYCGTRCCPTRQIIQILIENEQNINIIQESGITTVKVKYRKGNGKEE